MDKVQDKLFYINHRIQNEYDPKIETCLSDEQLYESVSNYPKVRKRLNTYRQLLLSNDIDEKKIKNILSCPDMMKLIIPPGAKGVARGLRFNAIIKNKLTDFIQSKQSNLELKFESKHPNFSSHEIPDWYIYDPDTKRILIGMNQVDFWKGGHQMNRGYKYVMHNKNNPYYKLVSVVCNYIQFKSSRTKAHKLFEYGFEQNTLCYVGNLIGIISNYFDIK